MIAFSRPTKMIKHSRYQIKLLYDGDMNHTMIDMQSSLDFRIDYQHNFAASLMKDEIITENGAKFMFAEVYFETKEDFDEFGKIIEFIDKETGKIKLKLSTTQSLLYVPQMFIADSKLWLNVRFDKDNTGQDRDELYKDNSVQCTVRIISDSKIRLYPDNSLQLQFQEIKKLRVV